MSRHRRPCRSFHEQHLQQLRPRKVSAAGRAERFIIPEIPGLRGSSFELCRREEAFAMALLGSRQRRGLRKHNLWLYRTDQQRFAGDFIVVDVSSRPISRGRLTLPCFDVFVIDLKLHAPLTLGGGRAGVQFRFAERAAEVAHRIVAEQWVSRSQSTRRSWQRHLAPRSVWLMVGGNAAVLRFFDRLRLIRRAVRRTGDRQRALNALS